MQTGSLGDVVFEVSSGRIMTPHAVALSHEARYEDHEVQGVQPRSEFLAPGLGGCTLALTLRRDLGVDPIAEAMKVERMLAKGEVVRLVIAGKNLGKWTVRKMDQSWRHLLKGVEGPLCLSLSVELKEYF